MFVAHEVFWDTTSAIVPTTRLAFFLPRTLQEDNDHIHQHHHLHNRGRRRGAVRVEQGEGDADDDQDEEEPMIVVGLNPPTPAPRKADASNRMPLNHPKFHHSNVTRKYYKKLSCPKNSSDTTQERPPNERVPTFVLGGTQKAGTSALYYLLKATNRVVSSTRFETHFFDNAVRRLPPNTTGASANNETLCQMSHDYRSEFPDDLPPDAVTFEKVRRLRFVAAGESSGRDSFRNWLVASMHDGMCVGAWILPFSLITTGPVVHVPIPHPVFSQTSSAVDEDCLYLAQSH
jgi:hypothetical protein